MSPSRPPEALKGGRARMAVESPGGGTRAGQVARALTGMAAPVLATLLLCGAAPAAGPAVPDDPLLRALQTAPDAATATTIERQLRERSLSQVTPAVRLLLARAQREQEAGETSDALEDLDSALDLQPDSPELHRQRAEVRAAGGDYAGAVRDIQAALARDPGDVAAWDTLSRLAQARGEWRNAFEAWQRVLALDPRTEGGTARLDELRRHAFGQPA